jgi:VWFA-related protein
MTGARFRDDPFPFFTPHLFLFFMPLLFYGSVLSVPAQEAPKPAPQEPVYTFPGAQARVEVRLGQVEVFVYDEKGQFVYGLRPEDFELTVDGKAYPVRYVDLIAVGKPPAGPEAPPPVQVTGEVIRPYQQAGAVPPRTPFNTFIILYDKAHTGGLTLATLRESLSRFLQELHRMGAYFMFVSLDAQGGFRVEHGLTQDVDLVLKTLERVGAGVRGAAWTVSRLSTLDSILERLEGCSIYDVPDRRQMCYEEIARDAFHTARNMGLEDRRVAQNLENSLRTVFEFLAHVPGRKSVLFVSEGFDPTGNYYLSYALQAFRWNVQRHDIPPFLETQIVQEFQRELSTYSTEVRTYEEIVRSANTAGLTVYWVNPTQPHPEWGAETNIRPTITPEFNVVNVQYQMAGIAERTGGIAWTSPTGLDKFFQQVGDDFRHYYLISFDLGSLPDNIRHHSIQVKVRRPGLKVRTRSAYAEIPWPLRVSRQLAAALDFADLYPWPDFPISFRHLWRTPQALDLHMSFAIPIRNLTPLTTTPDVLYDEIHVAWVVRGPDLKVIDKGYERLPIQVPLKDLPELEKAQAAVHYSKVLSLGQAGVTVAWGVLEAGGWKAMATRWQWPDLRPTNCPEVGSFILSSEVRQADTPVPQFQWTSGGHAQYKNYLLRLTPFQNFPPQGQLGGLYQVLLPPALRKAEALQVLFRLYRADGQPVNETPPTTLKFQGSAPEVVTNFFLLPYRGLSAGGYRLEVEVRTTDPPCVAQRQVPFGVTGNE